MIMSTDSGLFWIIVLVALVAYAQLFDGWLNRPREQGSHCDDSGLALARYFLAALPLLGLLGTIMGLLNTFNAMAYSTTDFASLMAGGVGTALGSTQLGLLLAAPGLVLHHYMSGAVNQYQADTGRGRA